MRRIREVLRLKFELSRSHREISAATGLSKGSVSEYLRRAREDGLTWELARELSDRELEQRLFATPGANLPVDRVPIDLAWVDREMRKKAVTLQLLWVEYHDAARRDEQARKPYQYSQFCERYNRYREHIDVVMRQDHRAGEKCFIDYSGVKPTIVDRTTGEVIEVELFVAVLGASNYSFAEVTRSQQRDELIASTARAFEFFGGVTEITVPDQLRSAVSGPDRIDPDINPVYAEFAEHYGTAVIPARPRKPKDKAKVEVGVLIVQRWIIARLRNVIFFSLEDLNVAIAELLEDLNTRPFQKLEGCRRSMFEQTDKPALRPLPCRRFEPSDWKKAKVHIDHHVEYEHRYYSASHALVGAEPWVRATVSTVELLLDGQRIASHARSYGPKGTYVTDPAHRPKAHRQYGAWPPERIVGWASEIGPCAGQVVTLIMKNRPHPEQGYRSCLALIRDAKRYSPERVEAACKRALSIGSPTRRSIVAILRNGLDRMPLDEADDPQLPLPVAHDNIRGGDYYATGPTALHQDDNEDDRRTDPQEIDRDEADGDGRCLPRAPEGSAEQRAELRGEARLPGRPGVDGEGEPSSLPPAASREADG
jgi:transposase